MEQIKWASERACALTRQLLVFSSRQFLAPTVLDLNELISNLRKMLERLISEHITLSTTLHPVLWPIIADPGQLEQVVMNLTINARDAMSQGGLLMISTNNVTLDAHSRGPYPSDIPPGRYVELTVSDTGEGMTDETMARIFEPLFTTKSDSNGTGLGLSTVYGIVKQSHGSITVASVPGQGATFKLYLPASDANRNVDLVVAPAAIQRYGSETILLVEDQDMVREIVRIALHNAGYRVLEASNGHDALNVAAKHNGTIDLLLTDVVMPQLGGLPLAEQLCSLQPRLKVIFMSGYTEDANIQRHLQHSKHEFLSKPFSLDVLATTVRQVLDQSV